MVASIGRLRPAGPTVDQRQRPASATYHDDSWRELELDVGDLIASRRTGRGPCYCDAKSGDPQLLERRAHGDSTRERIHCGTCMRTWTRVWV